MKRSLHAVRYVANLILSKFWASETQKLALMETPQNAKS